MTNAKYPLGREKMANGEIDWIDDDIRLVLLDDTYTYNVAHEFHDDLTGILATSGNFAGKTNVGGVLDANNVTLASVASGDDIERVVVYKWSGSSATSPLLLYFDRTGSSLPFVIATDDNDVIVRWSDGTNKIVKI